MFKGWIGEQKTEFNLRFSLDKKLYRRFHDVIIPSSNGTTQVDHILVSPFGLFIVETKNKMGWIYGSESQSKWTQVIYGKKYSFQNPLRQTHRHKKVLSKFLDLNESNIETIVYFNGDSTFKTELPSNVLSYGLGSYIKQFQRITAPLNSILYSASSHTSNDLFIYSKLRVFLKYPQVNQDQCLCLHSRLRSSW